MTMTKFLTTLRRNRATHIALALATTLATGGLVACSDNPTSLVTAPQSAPDVSSPTAMMRAPASYFGSIAATPSLSRQTIGDTTVTQFVLNVGTPGALYDIGNQSKIYFPLGALSVCDPAVSDYGPGTWDEVCKPLANSITITAKSWVNPITGGVNTDFSPELRFVPQVPMGVTLFLHDPSPSITDRINYCSNGVCVDDSQVDGTVTTASDSSGLVFRVIKHFSGYNVVVN